MLGLGCRQHHRPAPPIERNRLAICVPTDGHPTPGFVFSAIQLALALRGDSVLTDWDVALIMGDGSVTHDNREQLSKKALGMEATHILFLDDDMVFIPEAIFCLIRRKAPFVACNYPRRKPPHHFTASREDLDGLMVTDDQSAGLENAYGVGFGIALIERKVFEAIPAPWFMPIWDPDKKIPFSEDIMFCRRATKAGFPPQVDHDASKLIGHCSDRVLSFDDAEPLIECGAPGLTSAISRVATQGIK